MLLSLLGLIIIIPCILGLTHSTLSRHQIVQNAAAKLLTGTRKRQHTSVLAHLHWLPVKYRIDLKILLFVFKALNGLAPQYITNLITAYSAPRSLRPSSQQLLSVHHSCLKTKGDKAFSVATPSV